MDMNSSFKGKVILVGAGPGDPGLLTMKGHDAIRHADTVVYDHLVDPAIVNFTPPDAQRIYVGKKAGKQTCSQEEIHEILAREALAGKAVVRLKGGDPFIFGRGGEECAFLRERGIEFEIIPGVSALSAVPAYAGIPITCRDSSAIFVAVTGHEHSCKSESQVDWASLAKIQGTLIVFMGILNIRWIAEQLIQSGKSAVTPVAVIQWGTCPNQKTITGILVNIADRVEEAGIRPPGLIVIGEVVQLKEQLDWFRPHPNPT